MFYDEAFTPSGLARPHAAQLAHALADSDRRSCRKAGTRRDAIFMQQGITFDAAGPDADGHVFDRPFPLDLVPADEWTHIKRGLAQRIRGLNRFVDDIYHLRETILDGIVP